MMAGGSSMCIRGARTGLFQNQMDLVMAIYLALVFFQYPRMVFSICSSGTNTLWSWRGLSKPFSGGRYP